MRRADQSHFWRPVKKKGSEDHQFRAGPRFPRVAAKPVGLGNKPIGSYFTKFAGFVILPQDVRGRR